MKSSEDPTTHSNEAMTTLLKISAVTHASLRPLPGGTFGTSMFSQNH